MPKGYSSVFSCNFMQVLTVQLISEKKNVDTFLFETLQHAVL